MKRTVTSFCVALLAAATAAAADFSFRDQELPTRLTVGYAVRLLDMNDDQRLDICIVDSDRILWLENPSWTEHVILRGQTKKDNVCFAPYDIDGDGRLDFAVGAAWQPGSPDATKVGGTIQWITGGKNPLSQWTLHPIDEYPTTHRMNFADLDGDGKQELIVSPLQGKDTTRPNYAEHGTPLLVYRVPADPIKGPWKAETICDDVHVTHNFQVTDFDGDGKLDILLVSFEGVHLLQRQAGGRWQRTRIGEGNQATSPNKGSSEIKRGKLAGGADYIATIEPWHGHQVVVYTRPEQPRPSVEGTLRVPSSGSGTRSVPTTLDWLWKRQVLDEELKWGHAVWAANLDGDADQELIIGVRDNLNDAFKCGVRIYDPQTDGLAAAPTRRLEWSRHIVDPGSVAVEDLAAGDLNGDGRTDIVAVGRATHNVKIYWNEGR
jgi:aldos-2-ulose dehydratase/isomerase family protein/VCBS repeat protein/FG-GAP repeat protein